MQSVFGVLKPFDFCNSRWSSALLIWLLAWSAFINLTSGRTDFHRHARANDCLSKEKKSGDYRGTVHVASTKQKCLHWKSHPKFYGKYWSAAEAADHLNYCRNPNKDVKGPWCVVSKGNYEYCSVPICPEDIGCYEGRGESYFGAQDRSETGKLCTPWIMRAMYPYVDFLYSFRRHLSPNISEALLPGDAQMQNFGDCRNPGGLRSRPWCMVHSETRRSKDKQNCDVPRCSDASKLGYIKLHNDGECATNFVFELSRFSLDNSLSFVNCMAPYRSIYRQNRQGHFQSKFTDFCLYLVAPEEECPHGFMKLTENTMSEVKLAHESGPKILRSSENSIQLLTCCSVTAYFTNQTVLPYISVSKSSSYKGSRINFRSSKIRARHYSGAFGVTDYDTETESETSDASSTLLGFTNFTLDTLFLNPPLFVSVRKCPYVTATIRVIYSSVQSIPDRRFSALPVGMQCEYYPEGSLLETKNIDEVNQFALFVKGDSCPPGFEMVFLLRRAMEIFEFDGQICAPSRTHLSYLPADKQVPPKVPGYCLLVVPNTSPFDADNAQKGWGQRSSYKCPDGFRLNELHLTEPKLRLRFCCATPPDPADTKQYPPVIAEAPFGITGMFLVIGTGTDCPQFRNERGTFTLKKFTNRSGGSIKMVTIIGEDEIINFENLRQGTSVCGYLDPQMQLAVNAITMDCLGLGVNAGHNQEKGLCAFTIDDGTLLPPGRYCFVTLNNRCPQGFHKKDDLSRYGYRRPLSCCRNEESIGAIQLPTLFAAPFKLPEYNSPCQQIIGFAVDSEQNYCVYHPQGSISQAIIVWPKIVAKVPGSKSYSRPTKCLVTSKKRLYSQVTERRSRWMGPLGYIINDICLDEMPWSVVPRATAQGKPYCMFVLGACQSADFVQMGASPFVDTVICCSRTAAVDVNQHSGEADGLLRSFVTLGYPTEADVKQLDLRSTKVLSTNGEQMSINSTDNSASTRSSCPDFTGLTLSRRVFHDMALSKRQHDFPDGFLNEHNLPSLFNATNPVEFTKQTGIWTKSGIVYAMYCEYRVKRSDPRDEEVTEWPNGNYALPKSLNPCPKPSKYVSVTHVQDDGGFHYSQPIHLDGMYFQGHRVVSLDYCVFKLDTTKPVDLYPGGHYCVLRVNGKCGNGFTEGTISLLEGPISDADLLAVHGRGMSPEEAGLDIRRMQSRGKDKPPRREHNFCCRADSPSVDIPITGFPTEKGSFFLYRMGEKCQIIEGMRYTEEYICMNAVQSTDDFWRREVYRSNKTWHAYTISGLTPARIQPDLSCGIQIGLCYYQSDIEMEENVTIAHNTEEWPIGNYALPSVHRTDDEVGCPPGFANLHGSLFELTPNLHEFDIMPQTLSPYFIELDGHDSIFTLHLCVRDTRVNITKGSQPWDSQFQQNTLPPTMTVEEAAQQWPRGDYCVMSIDRNGHCPPGLDRHARSLKDICCRTDNIPDPIPVKWKFTTDFLLFGKERCLPIAGTHIERYLVRLSARIKTENYWDILCHYFPSEWFATKPAWPRGDYMLPIGRRSGLKALALTDTIKVKSNNMQDTVLKQAVQLNRYKCPDTFHRTRFTFLSQNTKDYVAPFQNSSRNVAANLYGTIAMEFCAQQRKYSASAPSGNDTNNEKSTRDHWPPGDYCVFVANADCPPAMKVSTQTPLKLLGYLLHWVERLHENGTVLGESVPITNPSEHVFYLTECCREDNRLILRLPATSEDGFYLKANSRGICSHIPHMRLNRERITNYFTMPLYDRKSSLGFLTLKHSDLLLHGPSMLYKADHIILCYYHPTKGFDYANASLGSAYSTTMDLSEEDMQHLAESCGCAENAVCILQGQQDCVCKPGYFGDGRHGCAEVTPLTDECANLCDTNAICAEKLRYKFSQKVHTQQTSHTCMCRSGYSGDGFSCRPDCGDHTCLPFSHCVPDYVTGTVHCKCNEGAVSSANRCNLDIYQTLHHRNDLSQFLVHHDHCLPVETRSTLTFANMDTFFYMFVPSEVSEQLMKSCNILKAHVVAQTTELTETALGSATVKSKLVLISLNDTIIELYTENGTLYVDGNKTKSAVLFTNGRMFYLSGPLQSKPYIAPSYNHVLLGVFLVLFVLAIGTTFLLVWRGVIRREHFRIFCRPITFKHSFQIDGDQDLLVQE